MEGSMTLGAIGETEENENIEQYDIVHRFWVEMVELRTMMEYHKRLRRLDNTCDFWTKLIPLVGSSGGVVGWMYENNWVSVCGLIILVAHLFTAIKPLLPFEIRKNKTFELLYEFSGIYHAFEEAWEEIMEGKLTKEEIAQILFDGKKKIIDVEHLLLPTIMIPEWRGLIKQAQADADAYFTKRYN